MAEKTKLNALLSEKCPVCREGDVFKSSVWSVSKFLNTYEKCPKCHTKYEPEPGFFWGAMYVNYGFNVATLTVVGLAIWLIFNPESPWVYVAAVIATVVLTIPLTSRFSRMMMLVYLGPFEYDSEILNKNIQE